MSEPKRIYITTPIYYASGEPHIGHAYATILADLLARFGRQTGSEVLFLTGTDEHGQKMQEEANTRGVEPIELCDTMAAAFRAAWEKLENSHDEIDLDEELLQGLLEKLTVDIKNVPTGQACGASNETIKKEQEDKWIKFKKECDRIKFDLIQIFTTGDYVDPLMNYFKRREKRI